MRRVTLAAAALTLGLALAPAAAQASPQGCRTVHDTITKTDNGHGTPSEWADLLLRRTVIVCPTAGGWTVDLADKGGLWTRKGAGSPNGTGAAIRHRVQGGVAGEYHLTVNAVDFTPRHRDTSLSSTAYVASMFTAKPATATEPAVPVKVTGGDYQWTYTTYCGRKVLERWVDSSANNDGQGAQAGNITGKLCRHKPKPHPHPTPTTSSPSPTGSPTVTPTSPEPSPTSPSPSVLPSGGAGGGGDVEVQPVSGGGGLPFTGDATGLISLIAGVLLIAGGGIVAVTLRRRRGAHSSR